MMRNQRWASKEEAKAFMRAYEKRVDTRDSKGRVIEGPKGLSYWAASDFVNC